MWKSRGEDAAPGQAGRRSAAKTGAGQRWVNPMRRDGRELCATPRAFGPLCRLKPAFLAHAP